jgi:hypothetical protein
MAAAEERKKAVDLSSYYPHLNITALFPVKYWPVRHLISDLISELQELLCWLRYQSIRVMFLSKVCVWLGFPKKKKSPVKNKLSPQNFSSCCLFADTQHQSLLNLFSATSNISVHNNMLTFCITLVTRSQSIFLYQNVKPATGIAWNHSCLAACI